METSLRQKPVILVVDDEEDTLILLQHLLVSEGFDPVISPNGMNVTEIIARISPDLVLLDLHMNGIDGGDICADIKSNPATSHLPVVIFSANKNIETIAHQCGAEGYIRKPFDAQKFRQTFQQALTHNHNR